MRYLLFILMLASPAMAVEPSEMLADPVLEARARVISKGLRCVVCQNENIDDSNAGIAADLRVLVRERLTLGDTDEETMQYVVDRYGEYVLLKPTFFGSNMILWLMGPFLLLAGGFGAIVFIRGRGKQRPEEGLDADEQEKLARLLRD
ncbi:MAG: cytochrome c-type biogenesis protein CcmH [Rhodobacteraceae bacterium]|nr:cytochrome c-type biogenesis protein CcmH [Paracoccaceae bacterium]